MDPFPIFVAKIALAAAVAMPAAANSRIKDITDFEGVRDNPLVGYGLVVGLDGTGDRTSQAPFTVQSLKNMLGELGVNIPANVNPQLKNVAAVAIHAELPAFAKPGQRIDVTVSTIGKAKSLRGGALVLTTTERLVQVLPRDQDVLHHRDVRDRLTAGLA